MSSAKPFGLAVKALVADQQDRILLVRRSLESKHFKHKWELPGGKVDPGETFDAGLLREVSEETGLSITIEGVAGVIEFPLPAVRTVVLILEARHRAGQVQLSHEHDAFQWLPRGQLCSVDLSEQLRDFLRDYCGRLAANTGGGG